MTRGQPLAAVLVALVAVLPACATDRQPTSGKSVSKAAAGTSVVRVAAASDLKFALDELEGVLAEQHPDVELKLTYGSSGTFLQQISNGAPFDVFLSADLEYPAELVDQQLASGEDVFEYAAGRLVVWTPEGSAVDPADGLRALARRDVRRVAIPNPEHAPYGRAAVAAMKHAGVYDEVRRKLVLGESVAQAADFVHSGGADAGVVAMSLVLSDPLRGEGRWVAVPRDAYPRLRQGGVVLASARDPEAARAVQDAMTSEEGRAVLERYWFFLPEGD